MRRSDPDARRPAVGGVQDAHLPGSRDLPRLGDSMPRCRDLARVADAPHVPTRSTANADSSAIAPQSRSSPRAGRYVRSDRPHASQSSSVLSARTTPVGVSQRSKHGQRHPRATPHPRGPSAQPQTARLTSRSTQASSSTNARRTSAAAPGQPPPAPPATTGTAGQPERGQPLADRDILKRQRRDRAVAHRSLP